MARPKILTDEEARERRREASRKAHKARRDAARQSGALEIRLVFTGDEAALLQTLREKSSVPIETWAPYCFLTGAKFVFNMGNVRGGKKRIRTGRTI